MLPKICRLVILGAPGSGKGTISKRIVDKFSITHIALGDVLRLNVRNNTELGRVAKKYMLKGELVPHDLIIKCITNHISDVNANNKSWLLDGFPRTIEQAAALDEFETLDAVINLDVPHNVIIERIKGRWTHLPSGRVYNIGFNEPKVFGKDDITGEDLIQRDDDKPDIVAKRLQLYETQTKPLLNYYNNRNILTTFKGTTTAAIWPQVEHFLIEKLKDTTLANRIC